MTRTLKILLSTLLVGVLLVTIFAVPRDAVMSVFAFLGVTQVATATITIIICRIWYLRRGHVPVTTGLLGWILGCFLTTAIVLLYSEGWDAFTPAFWSSETGIKGGLTFLWVLLGFLGALCMLPAVLVMAYYRRSDQGGANHVA